MEIDNPNQFVTVNAVQGEYYSREVLAHFRRNGSVYTAPDDATIVVRYRRADGAPGFYNFDPSGDRIATLENGRTSALIVLSDDLCSVAGRVVVHIDLYSISTGQKLSTFGFQVIVEKAVTDNEIMRKVNTSGVQGLLTDILSNVYRAGTPASGVIIDNTLTVAGAVPDSAEVGSRLAQQDTALSNGIGQQNAALSAGLAQQNARINIQDSKVNNLILVTDDEPNQQYNKLWIPNGPVEEIEIPLMSDVTAPFREDMTYTYGDFCNRRGKLYKYVSDTSRGKWDDSKWQETTLCQELTLLFKMIVGLRL